MQIQVRTLPDKISSAPYILAGIVTATFVIAKLSKRSKLDAIPTVGSSTWLGSWWAGITFLTNASEVIQEGYEKYKGAPFKVAHLYRWVVIVGSPQYVEEICKCSDDELSLMEAVNDRVKTKYMLGDLVHRNPYHVPIIRSQLTRNLGVLNPDMRDEIVIAFEETLNLKGDEWKCVPAFNTVRKVVCRTSNRIFVGLPLCRNPDWIDLNIRFAMDIVKGGITIGLFPNFLAPLVARFMTSIPGNTRRGMKHLGPIIEERQKYIEKYGNAGADKPTDVLSWLMDEATGLDRTIKSLTQRILTVNFVAIHVFTQALYNLAASPQCIQPLREEVESIIATEGWSKGALAKMRKVDSFLKETQRMGGVNSVSLTRKAMKDFTFSDGTVIPKGTSVFAASRSIHLDNELYENAEAFDPFRFAEGDRDSVKHRFDSTSPEYLSFGYGRHACPGRFFAANELKTMLAHIVVTYDIKLEGSATHPPKLMQVATATVADPTATVMFRHRAH
ncbi:cytochrome P450 [Melanogaster broomeanus]|nr:cytochrome P450 [Melanogaster broomeanus]